MSALPLQFLESLKDTHGFDRAAFERVHASGEQITSVRFNPWKKTETPSELQFGTELVSISNIPWARHGYYLSRRPSFTFDPLLHAGCYYVQEASSMFLEQALTQLCQLEQPLRVLDLSAAPGGKSTHALSLLSMESLLVSNDVIRARANILAENITRWGLPNCAVTTNDPRDFARLENFFDVIIADAPCSGSGLFRKDPAAIGEWSLNNVALCAQRQQRILADAWPALKPGGLLIYSTCSYSIEEDEAIQDWLIKSMHAESCQVLLNSDWGIVETHGGYRFWPDKVNGEGFFMACVKKPGIDMNAYATRVREPEKANRTERLLAAAYTASAEMEYVKHENLIYSWPSPIAEDLSVVLQQLRVIYSGCLVGELVRDKIIPAHSLALSTIRNAELPSSPLNYEQAIAYLQRKDISISDAPRGWQMVTYEGHSLGWINVLPNRINNYYPKQLRILKDK